jgi:exodeoxyribonuclease VII small subunit
MSPEVEPTFEEAYERLEGLIERLEEGGLSLEEAVGCYEEASALVARCNAVLDAAELRLRNVEAGTRGPEPEPDDVPF